MQQIFTS